MYVLRKCTVAKCHMSLTLEMCMTHDVSDIIDNVQEMSCVFVLKILILQDMYRKCTVNVIMSLILEMCKRHQISGNAQKISCILAIVHEVWNFWQHRKFAGYVIIHYLGNVHEIWNFHKLRKCACQVTFPKYQITTVFV